MLLFLSSFLVSSAQTFTYSTTAIIPDDSSEVCYPVQVSALPAVIDTSFGVINVCINLTHTWDDDLVIQLKAPDGTVMMLSNQNGGSNDDYTNTCFSMGASTYITAGFPPYTGTFIPEQSLNNSNNGQNPNGTWNLCIRDIFPLADQGTIYSWSITFGNNPPSDPPPPPMPCGMGNPGGCVCADGSTNCDLLPDMTASAVIIQNQHTEYPGYLTLSNATPNIGWGPMEVHGVSTCYCDTVQVPCSTSLCPNGEPPSQLVTQRIYHRNGTNMTWYDRPAGRMSYHPSHGHTHIDNWAEFSLRVATSNPDPLTWPIVGTGSKVSFCLINLGDCTMDYGYCVDTAGNILTMADIPNAPFGIVNGCGLDQGIYTGNLDIYTEGLPGMEIYFPGICNGNYHIVSITDPDNNFLEANENNNWVAVPVTLTDQAAPSGTASFTYFNTGNQFAFTNTTPVSSGFYWDFGDGTSDTVANPVHVYQNPGSYTVKLIITGQCKAPTTQFITVTSVKSEKAVLRSSLFPNPTKDQLDVSFYLTENIPYRVSILSLAGATIMEFNSEGTSGWNKQLVNLPEELANGVYLVALKAGVNSTFTKVIIAR